VIALPDSVFTRAVSTTMLDKKLRRQQGDKYHLSGKWKNKYYLCQKEDTVWYQGNALVVTKDVEDHQALLVIYHDALTAGYPGVAKMLKALTKDYWWPNV